MDKKQDEIRITVRFPLELIEQLRLLAKSETRSLNGEIVQAVRSYLEEQIKRNQKGK